MGIEIYARWDGQLPTEVDEQFEAWLSGVSGNIGYLREAYYGEPYATQHLVNEAFHNRGGARIAAATLRERLPETLRIAELREQTIYEVTSLAAIENTLQRYRDFVELCERVEHITGVPVMCSRRTE